MTQHDNEFDLNVIDVASPCSASWDDMEGNDAKRLCTQCDMFVYNLSAMKASQIQELVLQREQRTCVRFYRRSDGTVITADCPVGLAKIRKQVVRTAVVAGTLILGILSAPLTLWRRNRSDYLYQRIGSKSALHAFCDDGKKAVFMGAMIAKNRIGTMNAAGKASTFSTDDGQSSD